MARHLITSALPYINGVKHLGNLTGSMLPADVYARFRRQQGHDVLYICATDEHGTPAELAARATGLPVAKYCHRQHLVQADLGRRFGMSWDYFGRSSSPQNHELTKHFAGRLEAEGYLYERETSQMYSVADGRFLPDRYVVGSCPRCDYDRARGDQCEKCGSLLEPTELAEPRSAISGSGDLEVRPSRHLFLRQSAFQDELRTWIAQQAEWPQLTTSIALKWLDEGLRDRCITRDLEWGVPVEKPGFEGKVYYVWFDAPIEYIGATKEWADAGDEHERRDWRSWWFEADDVTYTQFMAKDNIPFHTLSFPCTLMGSREPWKLPDYIKGFNWLTYYGGKFSTSEHIGIFMDDALDLLPADYWRWYLVANAPEGDDVTFTWPLFGEAVDKDLANAWGNFVNRVLTLAQSRFGPVVPAARPPGEHERTLAARLEREVDAYTTALSAIEFRKAARRLRSLWTLGNRYVEETTPWGLAPPEAATVLSTAINLIRCFAILSRPLIPQSSDVILEALGCADDARGWISDGATALNALRSGHPYRVPPLLFRKIDPRRLDEWEQRFGGTAH